MLHGHEGEFEQRPTKRKLSFIIKLPFNIKSIFHAKSYKRSKIIRAFFPLLQVCMSIIFDIGDFELREAES